MKIDRRIVWNAHKPRFNAWACGHGPHKNRKVYDRRAEKRKLEQEKEES